VTLSGVLEDVVRELEAREEHTAASLGVALDRSISVDDVAQFVRFDQASYTTSVVARGTRWDMRLLCWQPGQTSRMHGHDHSARAFRVLSGKAVESVLGAVDRLWRPGDVVSEAGPHGIHQLGSDGPDTLLTLHLYASPLPVDTRPSHAGKNIVIVGGGFSGVAVATHLLRRADRDLRIVLIERGPWLGRGIAYGVKSHVFRLNVRASKMSLDPETPGDFVTWASAEATPDAFLPRARYGEYVVDRFARALRESPAELRVVRGEATRIERDAVILADGSRLRADAVVLATGLAPSRAPSTLPDDPRVIDAWDEGALEKLPQSARLLIVGAGLTAIDVITLLDSRGFSGSATIVSRRGLLPRPHLVTLSKAQPLRPETVANLPKDLRTLLAWGRRAVREVTARGEPWQDALDAMRPYITSLWRNLPQKDRTRFIRSVRPYWEVLRHRAPADAHDLIESWRATGKLEVLAGSVVACEARDNGLEVRLRRSGGGQRLERYDAIVRCIGPALDLSSEAPIIRNLIASGRAAREAASLGIATDDAGRVLTPRGDPDPRLFAIGALRRASSWETTSVPNIAVHALDIAKLILP
jgi:uncharacterized NAD(P)/FAD-binding protein YdhS/quercetin dioxygenase-like cupin family protein